MSANLVEINNLIQQIHQYLSNNASSSNYNNVTKLKNTLAKLQLKINKLKPQNKHHYQFFLAEVLSMKVNDHQKAKDIYKTYQNDNRKQVSIGARLRLSYIYSLQYQYKLATQEFKTAIQVINKYPEYRQNVLAYCQRLRNSSQDSNLFSAISSIQKGRNKQAIQHLQNQFKGVNQSNKFFAAKFLLQIGKNDSRGVLDYQSFIDQQYQEHQNGESSVKLQYEERKKYLRYIIINSDQLAGQSDDKGEQNLMYDIRKILAIHKLEKGLRKQYNLNPQVKSQLRRWRTNINKHDLINNRKNLDALQTFTSHQFQVYCAGQSVIDKKMQILAYNVFQSIRTCQRTKMKMKSNLIDQCQSRMLDQPNLSQKNQFKGSYMIKINTTSQGTQKRYFYFKVEDFKKDKLKLYYTLKDSKVSESDDSYSIKKIKKLIEGKTTKAMKRKQCEEFNQYLCFTIQLEQSERNFYVPDKNQYRQWIILIKSYMNKGNQKSMSKSRMTKSNKKLESKVRQSTSPMASSMTASRLTKSKRISFA